MRCHEGESFTVGVLLVGVVGSTTVPIRVGGVLTVFVWLVLELLELQPEMNMLITKTPTNVENFIKPALFGVLSGL